MRVFFDNCTSPVLAGALDALLKPSGDSALHIRAMANFGLKASSSDVEWITRLAQDRPADWVVITGDDNIRRNKAERTAWVRSGLRGFVLASGFQKMPINQCAAAILWRWPEMSKVIASMAGGTMLELPVNRNTKFKALSV